MNKSEVSGFGICLFMLRHEFENYGESTNDN